MSPGMRKRECDLLVIYDDALVDIHKAEGPREGSSDDDEVRVLPGKASWGQKPCKGLRLAHGDRGVGIRVATGHGGGGKRKYCLT